MILHWTEVYLIVLHFLLWYCVVSYGIAFSLKVLHFLLWYCIFSYGIALYLMVLHWYCMVFHCIACYCKMLHCILGYHIVSYTILRYCIVVFGARAVSRMTPIYFIFYTFDGNMLGDHDDGDFWLLLSEESSPQYILKVRVSRLQTPPIFGIFCQIWGWLGGV